MWKGNSSGVTLLLEEIRVWLGRKVSPKLFSSCKRGILGHFDHTQKWSGLFFGCGQKCSRIPLLQLLCLTKDNGSFIVSHGWQDTIYVLCVHYSTTGLLTCPDWGFQYKFKISCKEQKIDL